MVSERNRILLLISSIVLFFPFALSAIQNTQLVDSLIMYGREDIELGHYDNAIDFFLHALDLAQNIEDKSRLMDINKLLSETYEKRGDYRSANIYLRKLQNIQDSQFLLQLEKIHFYEQDNVRPIKHQTYIEKLEIAKKNQLIISLILLFVILFISFIIIILKDKHSKKRMQLIIDEQIHSLREKNLQLDKEMKEKGISEEKFKTIFNSATDSIIIYDINDYSIIDFNDRSCELYGYTREEFKNLSVEDLSAPSMASRDPSEAKIYLEKLLNGEVVFIEWEAKKKSGEIFWHDLRAKISLIDNEKRILVFARDITERKKAEMELKESQERYKQLIDNSPSLILEVDAETFEIINCNPAMAKSFGITVNKIIGKDIRELLPDEIFKSRIAIARKALEENRTIVYEDYNKGRFFYSTFIPLVSSNRTTLQIVAYDITDRKQAEMELKESETLLQSLIYNLPLDFYARDRNGKMFMQSARSIEKWGDQTGMTVDVIKVEDSIKKKWRKWFSSALLDKIVKDEYQIHVDNALHYMRVLLAPIKKDNEIIGILGVDIDITEIKKNEKKLLLLKDDLESIVETEIEKRKNQYELLIQKSKLESIGQLAAGIAHEINQPIGLISLGLDNISERLKSGSEVSEEYIKEKIDKIFKYIERVHQIIDHINTFSRDQKDIIFDEVNINNVIEQALYMIRMQYEDHDIHFDLHFGNLLPSILGNSYKIEQVILNLLSNSYDGLETKSKDNIELHKTITIKTFQNGKYVYLEFTDNGIGMSSKEMENIFNPFYTTKDPDKGTGLGLSISYGILQEMNAEISVKSKPNKFTTFTIKFQSC